MWHDLAEGTNLTPGYTPILISPVNQRRHFLKIHIMPCVVFLLGIWPGCAQKTSRQTEGHCCCHFIVNLLTGTLGPEFFTQRASASPIDRSSLCIGSMQHFVNGEEARASQSALQRWIVRWEMHFFCVNASFLCRRAFSPSHHFFNEESRIERTHLRSYPDSRTDGTTSVDWTYFQVGLISCKYCTLNMNASHKLK